MLLEIALVHLAAMASPGPNVLVVTRTASAQSRRAGLQVAGGVAAGSALWAAFAALGVAVAVAGSETALTALRVAGGAYLVWLGVRTVIGARGPVPATAEVRGAHAWRRGALTNLSNPKAAVFFVGVFAALVPADAPAALRLAAVGVVLAGSLAWHGALAVAFSTPRAQAGYERARTTVDRVTGTVIAAFGVAFLAGEGLLRVLRSVCG